VSRYDTLLEIIELFKPQTIVETGTWSGANAIRMLQTANKFHVKPSYIGYDLFEDGNQQTDAEEFNVKRRTYISEVEEKIKSHAPFAEIALVKGNTRETLTEVIADFAFIDGGHSLETIRHDYDALKRCNVIVLDDFYMPDNEGKMPDVSKLGCNKLVDTLPHVIFESRDKVEGGGIVCLAMVLGT
jgi:predicted O-methyltransferase YrrM